MNALAYIAVLPALMLLPLLTGCERPPECVQWEEWCSEPIALDLEAARAEHGQDLDWPSSLQHSACEDASEEDDADMCAMHGLELNAQTEDFRLWERSVAEQAIAR